MHTILKLGTYNIYCNTIIIITLYLGIGMNIIKKY